MKSIDIDLDVSKAIAAHQRDTDETPNTVLRRLLRLEPADAPAGSLVDKSRGLMVGVAVGNLLGIPYEGGRWHRAAIAEFPDGIREIAAKPGWPDDDDLAQSILLAEASIATDAYDINAPLARRGSALHRGCTGASSIEFHNRHACSTTSLVLLREVSAAHTLALSLWSSQLVLFSPIPIVA